jgi:ABC-type oligopeptide transport system substrate-binding subunit
LEEQKMKKRIFALLAVMMAAAMLFAACAPKTTPEETQAPEATKAPTAQPTEAPAEGKPYIAIISRDSSISSGRLYFSVHSKPRLNTM